MAAKEPRTRAAAKVEPKAAAKAEPKAAKAEPRTEPKAAAKAEPRTEAYDLSDIRVLAKILTQYDLSEVEVERGGQRVRLRRERAGAGPVVSMAPVAAATPAPLPAIVATPVAAQPADDGTAVISSPFVGTFYRAPSPEASPFVEAGQQVKKGQVLCIVEAMKLMNEIEAESACKIVEILVKNAEPVEYGQPLFKVFPLA